MDRWRGRGRGVEGVEGVHGNELWYEYIYMYALFFPSFFFLFDQPASNNILRLETLGVKKIYFFSRVRRDIYI